jgi:hypothetical protein
MRKQMLAALGKANPNAPNIVHNVNANVTSSPSLVTLMMEALSSSETSVLTRATRRNIPEDVIRHVFYLKILRS